MKIRIEGTQNEVTAAARLVAEVLDVHEVSRFYPNRGHSTLGRVYLTVGSPASRRVWAEATRLDRSQRPALPSGEFDRDRRGGA